MFDGIRAWFKPKQEVPELPRINDIALLNVARAVLEARKPEMFTMSVYGKGYEPCCALGHYAVRNDLQHLFAGLYVDHGKLDSPTFLLSRETCAPASMFDPEVLEHFGVTEAEIYELFGPCGCNNAQTTQECAQYIYDFVTRRS